jgi:hypothetical protein
MAPCRQVLRCQLEVQAGDQAHDHPHHDARFGAQQEGIGQAEDLVGQHASAQAEDQSLDLLIRRPGVSTPGGTNKGSQQGHVGHEPRNAQVNGHLEQFVVGVGDGGRWVV